MGDAQTVRQTGILRWVSQWGTKRWLQYPIYRLCKYKFIHQQ